MTPPPIRYPALDALRASAMLLGVLLHASLAWSTLSDGYYVRAAEQHVWADLAVLAIHGFRMELFFLMAGFFGRLVLAHRGPRGFLANRLERLGLPLLVGGLLLVPLDWAFRELARTSLPDAAALPHGVRGVPLHLWFLAYLVQLEAGALLASRVLGPRAAAWAAARGEALVRHPLRLLVLVPAAAGLRALTHGEPLTWTPDPALLAYYALFFAAGWALHRGRGALLETTAGFPRCLALAGAAFGGVLVLGRASLPPALAAAAGHLMWALYAWGLALGLLGLFLHRVPAAHPRVRLLADASYWTYLVHMPLVVLVHLALVPAGVGASLGLALTLGLVVGLCLASYVRYVRHGAVGRVLHGPRAPEPEAVLPPAPAAPPLG